jgi:hypothetical protein
LEINLFESVQIATPQVLASVELKEGKVEMNLLIVNSLATIRGHAFEMFQRSESIESADMPILHTVDHCPLEIWGPALRNPVASR